MTTERMSLFHGDALARHVDLLEQMLDHNLELLRGLPTATTPEHRRYELQLLHDLGLIAGELRSLEETTEVPPF